MLVGLARQDSEDLPTEVLEFTTGDETRQVYHNLTKEGERIEV